MSASSPVKSNESTSLFAKNIRLNLNSKFIPSDFFPQSISQHYRRTKRTQNQSPSLLKRKSSGESLNPQQNQSYQQAINLELIKKRLIKIKQSSVLEKCQQDNKKISFKKRSSSKQGLRKIIDKCKSKDKTQEKQKKRSKGCSKKLMEYMQKMKNVINIDINIQDDNLGPILEKRSKDSNKQNSSNNQSQFPNKIYRRRPKSQINSRQRISSKQKINVGINHIFSKPLKIKVKQVNKIMKESVKQKQTPKYKNDRYNKFVDIQLDQDGMLTFYGSPDLKNRYSYDSKKYTIRSSLPKLTK